MDRDQILRWTTGQTPRSGRAARWRRLETLHHRGPRIPSQPAQLPSPAGVYLPSPSQPPDPPCIAHFRRTTFFPSGECTHSNPPSPPLAFAAGVVLARPPLATAILPVICLGTPPPGPAPSISTQPPLSPRSHVCNAVPQRFPAPSSSGRSLKEKGTPLTSSSVAFRSH